MKIKGKNWHTYETEMIAQGHLLFPWAVLEPPRERMSVSSMKNATQVLSCSGSLIVLTPSLLCKSCRHVLLFLLPFPLGNTHLALRAVYYRAAGQLCLSLVNFFKNVRWMFGEFLPLFGRSFCCFYATKLSFQIKSRSYEFMSSLFGYS